MAALPSRTSTPAVGWVAADAVRLAGLLGLATAALWFDGVAVALMLLVLGGLMVPRVLGTPGPLDMAYGAGLVVAAWSGVLDVYERVAWWDVAVHFTVTGLVAAVAYLGTVRLGVSRDPGDVRSRAHRVGVPLVVVALGLGLSVVWEVGEWLGHTYVDASIHVSEVDTLGDLVAGGAGSLVAGALLIASARHAGRAGPPRHAPHGRQQQGRQGRQPEARSAAEG